MIWVRSTQWLKSTEWPQSGGIQPKDRKFGSSSGNKKILLLLWQVQTLDKKTLWVSERERERERARERKHSFVRFCRSKVVWLWTRIRVTRFGKNSPLYRIFKVFGKKLRGYSVLCKSLSYIGNLFMPYWANFQHFNCPNIEQNIP